MASGNQFDVGLAIKALRISYGMSRQLLASAAGMTSTRVILIEEGRAKPTSAELAELSELLWADLATGRRRATPAPVRAKKLWSAEA